MSDPVDEALRLAGLDPAETESGEERARMALRLERKRRLLVLAEARNVLDSHGKAAARRFLQGAIERTFDELRPPHLRG